MYTICIFHDPEYFHPFQVSNLTMSTSRGKDQQPASKIILSLKATEKYIKTLYLKNDASVQINHLRLAGCPSTGNQQKARSYPGPGYMPLLLSCSVTPNSFS